MARIRLIEVASMLFSRTRSRWRGGRLMRLEDRVTPSGSVVLDASGDLVITTGAAQADAITLRLVGGDYEIADGNPVHILKTTIPGSAGSGTHRVTVPLAAVTGNIRVHSGDANDHFVVDFAGGDIRHDITYDGGSPTTAPGDRLSIVGGTFATITGNNASKDSGDFVLESANASSPVITVTYTGLEPVLINVGSVDDLVFNLPAVANTATLGDDGTAGNGLSRLSGGTFEQTDFVNPTNSLTIHRGTEVDTITLAGLPDFNRTLKIGASAAPFGPVSVTGGVNLATGASLSVYGGSIITYRQITTAGGAVVLDATGDVTLRGPLVTNGGNQTLKADSDANGSGTFTLDMPIAQLIDPNPNPGNQFGATVVPLTSGNVVVTSPRDDFGGVNAGAVYLFNGATGQVISTLRGSSTGDSIGFGIVALTNGNFVIRNPFWNHGSVVDAGAATWGDAVSGVSGSVSENNSLVGSHVGDSIGANVIALTNGNYVAACTAWDNGDETDAGAVTWGNGAIGISGPVSDANSLVGSRLGDRVGTNITALGNGNYVVASQFWQNGTVTNAGAVTWAKGTGGTVGPVSVDNSLFGTSPNDQVGITVTTLRNYNYLVRSRHWDNGHTQDAGAVTWGNGLAGITGPVSTTNSIVGTTALDLVGDQDPFLLADGDFVLRTTSWDNGTVVDSGAVTWGSGVGGVVGPISAANSLVGSSTHDGLGQRLIELSDGHFVISSPGWDNAGQVNAGAVTWSNGNTGVNGIVSQSNSLIGSSSGDLVGWLTIKLSNGHYVVVSPNWSSELQPQVGAVTWGNGVTGTFGTVNHANSLTGASANDNLGLGGAFALANGNYVVCSPNWDNGSLTDVGAATWVSGGQSIVGMVTASNSLIGTKKSDSVGVGGAVVLMNGNYVVLSPNWSSVAAFRAGAVTWCNGSQATIGSVSSSNSLVGLRNYDAVGGSDGVTALSNGNYVVRSPEWDSDSKFDVGAVTWGNGDSGVNGFINSSNSLVGSDFNDSIGDSGVTALPNGNYLVRSSRWSGIGATTWASGVGGISGEVSIANSFAGSGGATVLVFGNSNFVVSQPNWSNGSALKAGIVTWGDGAKGLVGYGNASNSVVGTTANAGLNSEVIAPASSDALLVSFRTDGGGKVYIGSQTSGFSVTGGLVPGVGQVSVTGSDVQLLDAINSPTRVAVTPSMEGLPIDVGTNALPALGLTDGELDRINTGTLRIGSTTSRTLTVSAPISRPTATNLELISGGSVVLNHAISTAGGTLLLQSALSPAAIRPLVPGVDASASTVTLAGDLLLTFNGNVANNSHDQLNINGMVDLTSSALKLTGNYSLTGSDTLTIVAATGRTGTFTNAPFNGDTIAFGSQTLTVNYTLTGVTLRRTPTPITSLIIAGASVQRSMIRDITVTFGRLITFPTDMSSAFALIRTGPSGLTGPVTLAVDTSPSTPSQTIARLTFSGSLAQFGSLVDGNYSLQVFGNLLTDNAGQAVDADGDGTAGGTRSLTLHRLFGDADGNRTVNAADFLAFRLAFLGGSPVFDFNGDGQVGASDFLQFRLRFLTTLP